MRTWLTNGLLALTYTYFAALFGWALLQHLFGDRWWWLFLLSSLAIYLFLPLLATPLIALATRRHELWIGLALALLLWLHLFGKLFLPHPAPVQAAQVDTQTLTVMSYNMLRHNRATEHVISAIQQANADVVAVQELNVPTAAAMQRELAALYPYQILHPGINTPGMGVLSRYPLTDTGTTLPGRWFGRPQILTIQVGATTVTLFNLHALSTSLGYGGNLRFQPERMEASIREREQQMHTLMDAVATHAGPLIVAGDFNTTPQSTAYAIVTEHLRDAWHAAGWGLGHTFPGAAIPGSSRPAIAGLRIPQWLIRIDYIFFSPHWSATSAQIGPWDGMSDHRPVIAELVLKATP